MHWSGSRRWTPRTIDLIGPRASRGSVGFRPDDTLRARSPAERAHTRFLATERDAANRDLQVILDLRLDFRGTVPMRQRESAVNLGLLRVFRGEVSVELVFRIDVTRVRVAKRQRPRVERILN